MSSPARDSLSPLQSDLRHMTSHPALLSPNQVSTNTSPARQPQQLSSLSPNSSRPGSRSPSSIPSSPTSIHSSSSAIFERDIESPPSASPPPHLPTHPPNPHRTPRSKATEHVEQSVPSVLAEAASALAGPGDNDIAVIAPAVAPVPMSFSQAGSVGSRSPRRSTSPSPSPKSRNMSLPSVGTSPGAGVAATPARPTIATRRTSSGPKFPGAFESGAGISPTTPTTHTSPIPSPTTAVSSLPPAHSLPDTAPPTSPSSIHTRPQPTEHSASAHQKRLSFVSYSDLLSSTPMTSLPLSSLTSPHSTAPPPHLPAVSAAASSPASSSRPLSTGTRSRPLSTYSISTTGNGGRAGGLGLEQLSPSRRTQEEGVSKRLKDDIGGEWEREGFGKGLEERLEELMVGKA